MSISKAIAKLANDLARSRNLKGNRGPDGSLLTKDEEIKRILDEMEDTVFPEGGVASDADVVASVSKGINNLENLGYEAAGIPEDVLSAFLVASGKNKVDKKLVDKAKKGFDERMESSELPLEYEFSPEGVMSFSYFNRKAFAKSIENPKDRESIKEELIKSYYSFRSMEEADRIGARQMAPQEEARFDDIKEALTILARQEGRSLDEMIGEFVSEKSFRKSDYPTPPEL